MKATFDAAAVVLTAIPVTSVVGGAMLRAYLGGSMANGGQLNMCAWDYKNPSTYAGIILGGVCGGVAAYEIGKGMMSVKLGLGSAAIGSVGITYDATDGFSNVDWTTAAGGGGSVSFNGGPSQAQVLDAATNNTRAQYGAAWHQGDLAEKGYYDQLCDKFSASLDNRFFNSISSCLDSWSQSTNNAMGQDYCSMDRQAWIRGGAVMASIALPGSFMAASTGLETGIVYANGLVSFDGLFTDKDCNSGLQQMFPSQSAKIQYAEGLISLGSFLTGGVSIFTNPRNITGPSPVGVITDAMSLSTWRVP